MIARSLDKRKILIEDALKCWLEREARNEVLSAEYLAGALDWKVAQSVEIMVELEREGWIERQEGRPILTEEGRAYALRMTRAHRVYETFLARESGWTATDWHERANRAEHRLTAPEVDSLADRLGRPRYDPHGDPIPTRDGRLPPPLHGMPLVAARPGAAGAIVHMEDEPPSLYKRLIQAGLHAGMRFKIKDRDAAGFHLNVEGREMTIGWVESSLVQIRDLNAEESVRAFPRRLLDLRQRESSWVAGLSPLFQGSERLRLLDLGFVPGSRITLLMGSPLGSPLAYRVRGTQIALRREQAEKVYIDDSFQTPSEISPPDRQPPAAAPAGPAHS